MYEISKDFHFSAAHQLLGLAPGHKCANPHGHNYICRVTIRTDILDELGFVLDYGDLAPLKHFIDTQLDHQDLNEVFGNDQGAPNQTSAENLAKYIYDKCRVWWPVYSVSISETLKTWATYYGVA